MTFRYWFVNSNIAAHMLSVNKLFEKHRSFFSNAKLAGCMFICKPAKHDETHTHTHTHSAIFSWGIYMRCASHCTAAPQRRNFEPRTAFEMFTVEGLATDLRRNLIHKSGS
jgi:hypothetical protein